MKDLKNKMKSTRSVGNLNRIALFVVFFWFGFLKIIGLSPAEELVEKLFELTLAPFLSIDVFLPVFGAVECLIGIVWLFPKLTKVAFYVLLVHMVCAFIPMLVLKEETWQSFLVLTFTGQYIVKNIVLVSSGWFIYTSYFANEEVPEIKLPRHELVHV